VRILVVEDEPAIAAGIRLALSDDGHAVDTVANGRDAIDWVEAAPYGLVILDVILPGMSGLDVCQELRHRGFRAPILMLTALTGVDDRVDGLDRGADDYLGKPFAIAELKARIRALVRRSTTTAPPTIRVGDLELDPRSLAVARGGRPIRLTAREFAFLELLARHPGQVFPQEHVIAMLWPADSTPGSNIVEVYIRSLRRKVDSGRRDGLIETVRGAGYRLRPPEVGDRGGEGAGRRLSVRR
jgi:two-component system OmpR family response regulator